MQNYLKPIFSMGLLFLSVMSVADNTDKLSSEDTIRNTNTVGKGFVLSGYGEVVMTRNFYSDYIYRYSRPQDADKNGSNHGRFDIPHVTLNLGYNFGKGWSLGMELEYEHGGTGSSVEVDADESGEYESETEKGGEVALE